MDRVEGFDHEKILKTVLRNGGEHADLYYEKSLGTQIVCDDDRIERVITGIDFGVGVRLIKNLKTAYAFTNDIRERSITDLCVELSSAFSSKGTSVGEINLSFLDPAFLMCVKMPPSEVDITKKIEAVYQANDSARSEKNIRQVKVIYRDIVKDVLIASSMGHITRETRIGTVLLVQVVASRGDILQTGYEPVGGTVGFELFDDITPAQIAKISTARANTMLEADRAPGGQMAVVLSSEAGGTMIHEAVGHGLEADLAGKKLSVYSGSMGEKVASGLITVIDDSTIPKRRGSFLFDDEGTPSQKTVLVDNGVLVNYMYDNLSAIKEGCKSTGNGRRESYRHKPIPRMTNTIIQPGDMEPEDIISSVKRGLLVKKMGGGQVNTINGQFVFEVTEGYFIERGKIKGPVRGAILTGSGPDILMEIDMVGNDLGYGIGTCGKDGQGVPVADAQPTLRIPSITVGGKV